MGKNAQRRREAAAGERLMLGKTTIKRPVYEPSGVRPKPLDPETCDHEDPIWCGTTMENEVYRWCQWCGSLKRETGIGHEWYYPSRPESEGGTGG